MFDLLQHLPTYLVLPTVSIAILTVQTFRVIESLKSEVISMILRYETKVTELLLVRLVARSLVIPAMKT